MRKVLGLGLVALLPLSAAQAQPVDPPSWAYMVAPPGTDARLSDPTVYTREGSDLELTQAVVQAPFTPPDWYPNEHPPKPSIVEFGRQPIVQPCMRCHLPNGGGHPESGYLAGLPADYFIQQMRDFASGARAGLGEVPRSDAMVRFAQDMTEEEFAAAAEYYASLPPVKWTRVVEAENNMVPVSHMPEGTNMRHVVPDGGMEPIGLRVVEVPEDSLGASLRDSHASFIAYVPQGAIAAGQELATTGGNGKTAACAICHGEGLRGLGAVPPIAGRSPAYMTRQLIDFQHRVRNGASAALMHGVVDNLTEEDIVNLVSYVGSLDP